MHCKFDQLCSLNLFRLYRACVKLSNLALYVLTMTGSEKDTPGTATGSLWPERSPKTY